MTEVNNLVDYPNLLNSFKNGLKESAKYVFNEAKLTPNHTVLLLEKIMIDLGELWQAGKIPLCN